jgi:hypothetical protein
VGDGRRSPRRLAAPAAMEVLATPGLRMLISCHVDR